VLHDKECCGKDCIRLAFEFMGDELLTSKKRYGEEDRKADSRYFRFEDYQVDYDKNCVSYCRDQSRVVKAHLFAFFHYRRRYSSR
jgi:hypothetical protein